MFSVFITDKVLRSNDCWVQLPEFLGQEDYSGEASEDASNFLADAFYHQHFANRFEFLRLLGWLPQSEVVCNGFLLMYFAAARSAADPSLWLRCSSGGQRHSLFHLLRYGSQLVCFFVCWLVILLVTYAEWVTYLLAGLLTYLLSFLVSLLVSLLVTYLVSEWNSWWASLCIFSFSCWRVSFGNNLSIIPSMDFLLLLKQMTFLDKRLAFSCYSIGPTSEEATNPQNRFIWKGQSHL